MKLLSGICILVMKNSMQSSHIISKKGYLVSPRWKKNCPWLRICWVANTLRLFLFFPWFKQETKKFGADHRSGLNQIEMYLYQYMRSSWVQKRPKPSEYGLIIWLNILQLVWYLKELFIYMFNYMCVCMSGFILYQHACQRKGHLVIFTIMNLITTIYMVWKLSISVAFSQNIISGF